MPEGSQSKWRPTGYTQEQSNAFEKAWEAFEPLTPQIQAACDTFNQDPQNEGLRVHYSCVPYKWGTLTGTATNQMQVGTDTPSAMSPQEKRTIANFAANIADQHGLAVKRTSTHEDTDLVYSVKPKFEGLFPR
jgi:hypothetical protein